MRLTFRKVTINDIKITYEWRNDESVRKYFFDNKFITYQEHVAWFSDAIGSNNRCMLMIMMNDQEIGVLRFDLKHDIAEVSIYIDPSYHGQGLGSISLKGSFSIIKKLYPQTTKLIAKILPQNVASQNAFTKAGFNLSYYVYELEYSV